MFQQNDMELFIKSYSSNYSNNVVKNTKIPVYIEFLKRLHYYGENNIICSDDEMYSLKKMYQISNQDLKDINKYINQIKSGRTLYKKPNKLNSLAYDVSNSSLGLFEEKDEYINNGFEILNQVSDVMDEYKRKMQQNINEKLEWKKKSNNYGNTRNTDMNNFINSDRYYQNSEKINIDYDKYSNPTNSCVGNLGTVQKINNAFNNLNSNDVDYQTQTILPNLYSKRKISTSNEFDKNLLNLPENRFMQDVQYDNLMNNSMFNNNQPTKEKNRINNNGNYAEHGFNYLNKNPNHALNERLISVSCRMDNKSYVMK
jgi:hypothetical protein